MRYTFLICSFFMLLANMSYMQEDSLTHKKKVRVLILIITSDQFPVYSSLQEIWKSYMHSYPDQVETYFIRASSDLPTIHEIHGDTIWAKATEGWPPKSSGIIDKTILSMEAIQPRLDEFDYILRTNLSSFYIFPRLLEYLQSLPRKKCYAGYQLSENIASGSGFILSPDLVKMIVAHKNEFIGNKNHDDILIGRFFMKKGVKLHNHDRIDLLSLNDWEIKKNKIPPHIFQFRIKTEDSRRLTDDIYIHSQLLSRFYL